jgi:hypothetical protein
METIFVSIICVALIVVGGMTMSRGFLSSMDNTSANIDVISQRNQEIMRTNISVISASQTNPNTLEVSLRNTGQTKLTDFGKWDVIVHHTDFEGNYSVTWLPFSSSSPGNNQWTVDGIYSDAAHHTAEVFEPGIFNPDEEMVIRGKLDPLVGPGTPNWVLITTPNGVTVSKTFTGYTP